MKRWEYLIWLFVVLFAAVAVGQDSAQSTQTPPTAPATQSQTQTATQEPIHVWADASSYKYYQDSTKSYVEIYTGVKRADFQFEELDGEYRAGCLLYAEAIDTATNAVVDSVSDLISLRVKYLEDAYDNSVRQFEVLAMLLPPGVYRMKVTAVDVITKRSGISTFGLSVKNYDTHDLMASDIEFAYDIRPVPNDKMKSDMIKAHRIIQPNPNRYVSNDDSLLYVYLEVYNLGVPTGDSDKFELKPSLHDRFGYEIRDYPVQTLGKPGTSAVVTKGIPIFGIPGGEYELDLAITDKATGEQTTTSKSFVMIYSFDQLAPTMTRAGQFTEEDADLMAKVIRYISTKEEKKTYDQLDLNGKRQFLTQFWERKNPKPGNGINVYKDDIFRRFAYANQNFSTNLVDRTDGWRTDRGRIYITYGDPDDIVRHPSQMDNKPVEIWRYYSLPGQRGNDYCIFVDQNGYGDYQLMSSSLIGEIKNPQWDNLLTEF